MSRIILTDVNEHDPVTEREYFEGEAAFCEDEFYEDIICESCGWSGTENELETDYYEQYCSSMPLATICPNCKCDTA